MVGQHFRTSHHCWRRAAWACIGPWACLRPPAGQRGRAGGGGEAAARPGADARGARARAQVWDRRALGRGAKPAGVLVGHTEGLTHLDSRGARPRCPRGAAPACAAQGTQTRALRHSASCCSVCVVCRMNPSVDVQLVRALTVGVPNSLWGPWSFACCAQNGRRRSCTARQRAGLCTAEAAGSPALSPRQLHCSTRARAQATGGTC